jgi:hypothetical protein
MTARVVLAWVVAAVLGLALAAGITFAASQLSSQHVGLSGEPLSAGDELAPRSRGQVTTTEPSAPRHDRNEAAERGEQPDGDD